MGQGLSTGSDSPGLRWPHADPQSGAHAPAALPGTWVQSGSGRTWAVGDSHPSQLDGYGPVVGHIAFSPVTLSDGSKDWYGPGPVSVHPDYQRKDIGRAIGRAVIKEGLECLNGLCAKGCCLVGHPQYHRQFGFRNVSGLKLEGVPPRFFSYFPWMGTSRNAMSCSTKDSVLTVNKTQQRTVDCYRTASVSIKASCLFSGPWDIKDVNPGSRQKLYMRPKVKA